MERLGPPQGQAPTTQQPLATAWNGEHLFRSLMQTWPDSIMVASLEGAICMANQRTVEIFGFDSLDQVLASNVLDLVAPFDRPRAGAALRERAADLVPSAHHTVYTLVRHNGTTFPAEVSSSAVADDEGTVQALTIVARDIPERQSVEQRYRDLFEHASDTVFTLDLQGNFVSANRAAERISGYNQDEIRRLNMAQVIAPEYLGLARQMIGQKLEGERRTTYELEIIAINGARVLLEISTQLLYCAGLPVGIQGIGRDITERKGAEEELARLYQESARAAAEREAILGQIADGVVIADAEGDIVFMNAAACRIYATNMVGLPVEAYSDDYELFTLNGQPFPPEETALARAVRRGETVMEPGIRVHRADGSEVVVNTSAAPVLGEDGAPLGAVVTVRDMTAEYEMARQKDDFLSAAAHDLKTPLTTIKGHAQLLQKRAALAPEGERLVEGLQRIDGVATRMTALINELLDVNRVQMGKPLDLVLKPVELVALARPLVADAQSAYDGHRIVLISREPAIHGQWDLYRVERVVGNLLSNALAYSPDGGAITVTVDREGDDWALLQVSDQGLGIPATDLPHIFERFHRGGNVAGRIAGSGIGLAAVRQIVEQHGGAIDVESREGEGSTFAARLPLG